MQVRANLEQVWTDQDRSGGNVEPIDLQKLCHEIKLVRWQGIRRIDPVKPARLVRRELPVLRLIAARHRVDDRGTFSDQVETLLSEAIENLTDPTERDCALILFDLLESFPRSHAVFKVSPRKPNKLREFVLEYYIERKNIQDALSKDQWRQGPEAQIIDAIAKSIVKITEAKVAFDSVVALPIAPPTPLTGVVLQPNSVDPDLYVRRLEQETKFRELVNQYERLIVIVGQTGIGKSWLARYVTRLPDGSNAPRIRLINGVPHMQDVQAAYSSLQIDARHVIDTSPESYLAHLINCEQAPSFVVIDDLSSTDQLTRLSLSGSKSVVVVTSRTEGDIPISGAATIYLNLMTQNESKKLVTNLLPSLSAWDAHLLSALTQQPSVISHACRLIAYRGINVKDFVQDLVGNPIETLRGVRTPEGVTQYDVIMSVVGYVRERDKEVYELLLCIGLLDGVAMQSFLKKYFSHVTRKHHEVRYAEAISLLHRLSLITVTDWGEVVMDNLTLKLLSSSARETKIAQVKTFAYYLKKMAEAYLPDNNPAEDGDFSAALLKSFEILGGIHQFDSLARREYAVPLAPLKKQEVATDTYLAEIEAEVSSWFDYLESIFHYLES